MAAMFPTSSLLACSYSPPHPHPRRFCIPRLQLQRGLTSPSPSYLLFLRDGSTLAMPSLRSMLSGSRCAPPQAIIIVERDLHMVTGDGENSYAANSVFQRKAVMETWPELHKAVREALKSLSGTGSTTMVAADLGCSSGPNTLLVVSEVMNAIGAHHVQETASEHCNSRAVMEVQFFLNDLPGNDFNLVFRSLDQQRLQQGLAAVEEEKAAVPCYIAGLPGSMYTRILPCQSVHLFHSSHCLMWRSKIPDDLSNATHVNADNIYIGKTTPKIVSDMVREQFEKDFQLFLSLRHKELVSGGCMVLTFLGRRREEMAMQGGVARVWEVLSQALQHLVHKGRVVKKKLSSFNMPYYAPSIDEVMTQLIKQNDLFNIEDVRLFESNWDAYDDSDGDVVLSCHSSAKNIAKIIRAAIEPLIMNHFGEDIVEDLFKVYASILAKNLEKGKAMCPVIVVMLKKPEL